LANTISWTKPLFIEISVPSHDSEYSRFCNFPIVFFGIMLKMFFSVYLYKLLPIHIWYLQYWPSPALFTRREIGTRRRHVESLKYGAILWYCILPFHLFSSRIPLKHKLHIQVAPKSWLLLGCNGKVPRCAEWLGSKRLTQRPE